MKKDKWLVGELGKPMKNQENIRNMWDNLMEKQGTPMKNIETRGKCHKNAVKPIKRKTNEENIKQWKKWRNTNEKDKGNRWKTSNMRNTNGKPRETDGKEGAMFGKYRKIKENERNTSPKCYLSFRLLLSTEDFQRGSLMESGVVGMLFQPWGDGSTSAVPLSASWITIHRMNHRIMRKWAAEV